ncbi:protein amalgam-like [Branchiostoma lanceolatum]|uniref:protein amalgam-like n=1 Tax=Branchiostoma lanceolatum TaxID=7740 RepID=UPI003451503D
MDTRMRTFLIVTVSCVLTSLRYGVSGQSSIGLTLPKSVNTIVGDPVTLPATFQTSRRIISVSWVKVKTETKRTSVLSYYPLLGSSEAHGSYEGRAELVGRASLKLSRTEVGDEGTYVLSIVVQGLGTEEGAVKLNLLVPPKVTVGPSNPYVTSAGRTATLSCTVKDAKPNVTSLHWEKNSVKIDSEKFDTKYSGGNLRSPDLAIRHVTRADGGLYKCVTNHVVRSTSATLKVEVLYAATILTVSDSLAAVTSERVILQCVAEGNPPPDITWMRNGVRLRSVTRTVSHDTTRAGSVVLQNVQMNATGTYVCTASNGVGKSDIKSLQLSVKAFRSSMDENTIAILVGSIAGGLWLFICLGLTVYFFRRRRDRAEKKRFSFYYNMGRGQADAADSKAGEETLEVTRHPNLQTPAKTVSVSQKGPYAGIETIRRTTKGKVRRYAQVLYAYHAQEENELYMETGDVIEVLEGEDGGWCLGYLKGRIGLFPSNYVKFLSASQVSAAKIRELYSDASKKQGKSSI